MFFSSYSDNIIQVTFDATQPASSHVLHSSIAERLRNKIDDNNETSNFTFSCKCERCGDYNMYQEKVHEFLNEKFYTQQRSLSYLSIGSGGLEKDCNNIQVLAQKFNAFETIDLYFADPLYEFLFLANDIDKNSIITKELMLIPSVPNEADGCMVMNAMLIKERNTLLVMAILQAKMFISKLFQVLKTKVTVRMFLLRSERNVLESLKNTHFDVIIQENKDYGVTGTSVAFAGGEREDVVNRGWLDGVNVKSLLAPEGLFIMYGYRYADVFIKHIGDIVDIDDVTSNPSWKLFDNCILSRAFEFIVNEHSIDPLKNMTEFRELCIELFRVAPERGQWSQLSLLFSTARGTYAFKGRRKLDSQLIISGPYLM